MTDQQILAQIDEQIATATRLRNKPRNNEKLFHFFDGEVRGLMFLKEQIEQKIAASLDEQAKEFSK